MFSWFWDTLYSFSFRSVQHSVIFGIAVCDLIVHCFFKIAFGVNVKPAYMMRWYNQVKGR